jgi:hypothetical protein
MSKASGLFFAAAGAASLIVACVIPWQDFADLDVSPPSRGDVSITPTGEMGPNARVASRPVVSRTGLSPDADRPASPPELATLAPRTALGSPQKEAPFATDRPWLGRELQRELARVGCYEGELHGIWTPAARKAMKAFTDRVNATLPTEEPDYILLSLVQAARDKVCGANCPADQVLADGGRCVPSAILAGKKSPLVARAGPPRADPAPGTGWSLARTATSTVPPAASDPATMGLAGPPALARPPNTPAPGAPRSADAKRTTAQPTFFGLAIFKQFEKLGF